MEEILQEINSTWQSKFFSNEEWNSYKRHLLKWPDRVAGLGPKYFDFLAEKILTSDLSKPDQFEKTVDFFNSLLRLRKTDCILKSLKKVDIETRGKISEKFDPKSVFVLSLFKNSTSSEFCTFFQLPDEDFEKVICFHLPFKVKAISDVEKLVFILRFYKVTKKSLESVLKVWSEEEFLISSLWHNKPLTVFIHSLMTKDLPSSSTTLLYKGIQNRLSSNNQEIALSGLVIFNQVIASRVGQLLDSDEIMKYSIDDYLKGKQAENSEDEDNSEEQVPAKVNYLEEVLNSLVSADRERFLAGFESCPEIILEELVDLDLHFEKLAEILMKLENKFAVTRFEEKRFQAIVNLTFVRPKEMAEVLVERVKKNCSTGDFLMVLDVFRETSRKLANFEEKKSIFSKTGLKNEEKKESRFKVIHERLEKKTRRFFIREKKQKIFTQNLFLPLFSDWVGKILKNLNEKFGYLGISKVFYTLGELVENTGGTCDFHVVQQCVYIIKALKPFISSQKREISESAIYLLINISSKINGSPLLSEFESLFFDLQEISTALEKVCPELEELATKALLLIAYS
jgi:hypothetical protein